MKELNFKNAKLIEKNISELYQFEDSYFYIEPNFCAQLYGLINQYPEKEDVILNKIEEVALKNKKVIFTADFNFPVEYKEGYIYLELVDICNKLMLFYDNKGNPESDYGD